MVYDAELADRLRECVSRQAGLSEKPMFGGLAFLVNGNLAVSVSSRGGLMLRVDPAQTEALATRRHATRFQMRGRDLDGWLRVDADGVRTSRDLQRWVKIGVTYAQSLPPKQQARGRRQVEPKE